MLARLEGVLVHGCFVDLNVFGALRSTRPGLSLWCVQSKHKIVLVPPKPAKIGNVSEPKTSFKKPYIEKDSCSSYTRPV